MLEDSDEDVQDLDADAYRKGLSAYKPSPEPKRSGTCYLVLMCRNIEVGVM